MTQPAHDRSLLRTVAALTLAAPRRFLVTAVLVAVAAGIFAVPVAHSLCACGMEDPSSESARAIALLANDFHQSAQQIVIVVSTAQGYRSVAARQVGEEITGELARSPHVTTVTSAWTAPPASLAGLVSDDGRSALIVAGISGDETGAPRYAKALADNVVHDRDGVTVRAGGTAMVNLGITEQSQRDLFRMESLAIPLSFLVLVWVFGGLLAAAVPVAVGVMAIVGSLAVLRIVTLFTDVSIFALNLTAALGLALAIDYTLLMVNRYRDEVEGGAGREDALATMMVTAGRTVLFSATIVALSMAVMVLFPMHFLKSFAYAGVATVVFAALAALLVTPAAIALLGARITKRRKRAKRPVQEQFLYRSTRLVMRRAVPFGLAVVVLLLLLGAPFAGVRWGFPDDRVLPRTASAHQIGDQLRNDFVDNSATAVTVVVPDTSGLTAAEMQAYRDQLAGVADVSAVSPPVQVDNHALLTVYSTAPLFSERSEAQLDRLHAVPWPGGRDVLIAGTAQTNRDSVNAIASRLPVVLGVIAAIMFVLLFLLTGSVAIPLKALVLNLLSLTATFGAMVWIFQDGHLDGLGTTPTGMLVANVPVLLFCIAFGLSMDYEVFLVSRIREFWLAGEGNDASVALGIAHTGRVVTAAAAVMAISFAALVAAQVSFMRMFGLGLTLAVLVDATLVRMVLMPAFMHLLGEWNWWAPKWLARLHHRVGLHHGDDIPDPPLMDVTSGRVLEKGRLS
ncbi:MmpL domain-containing protein [uncultured Mycobacterium sp.]|uniref:MmpL domain-containing protein n=1 Tax=uncultured Mycobacterium sp. TaxID=171292 RepID=A0A1Y5PBP6_9MYCO|nr:MmpL domain-containing protein [uncultured Mycobacterium sp.]